MTPSPPMNHADRAEQLFRQGYNCAQSVFGAFAEDLGLTLDQATKTASAFGAGFGKLREVCGAVCAMTLIAGILKGYVDPADRDEKKRVYALERSLAAQFKAKHGTYVCRELLGLAPGEDSPEPAVRTEEYYATRPCIGAIRTAAELAGQLLAGGGAGESGRDAAT